MKIKDLMTTDVRTCSPGTTLAAAGALMLDGDCGILPVVKNGKLVGIVTDRDLALKVVAEGRDPAATSVHAMMTSPVVTCLADDDLQIALDAMATHQLRRIPVVNSEQAVVGIVAQADVAIRGDQPEKTAEVVKQISQSGPK